MRPFVSKDGREIEPVDHEAYFGGSNNNSKGKVLIYLLHIEGQFRTARQLHEATGVSYAYLRTRLSFWYNIRYINRKVLAPARGSPCWAYAIAERGKNFLTYRLPPDKRNELVKAINEWQSIHSTAIARHREEYYQAEA